MKETGRLSGSGGEVAAPGEVVGHGGTVDGAGTLQQRTVHRSVQGAVEGGAEGFDCQLIGVP
ncbi:hypothetical protein [Streptomyces triticiradicis]|uniref:Uncharacterized protein n=1 Tax=Streptomyces triticiradicis TaxID=2651189 RepID=A0A7J5D2X4_9ACTN|nr:hypothetical protein [Streptomyces triticiradicis]KAB1977565.1 hypothetical protein F8144_41565 [Streptomyces triticiradicis]